MARKNVLQNLFGRKLMSEIFYSEDHLWFEEENKTVKVGIADNLKNRFSPESIQIAEAGTALGAGSPVVALESSKATYEFTTPFACKIVECNELLQESPSRISQQEESLNWLYIAEICDEDWNNDLMSYDEYQDYIEP